ncbi:hypothetical protein WISP_52593 [Willisornis vidua]|uniref:Uncharacterized protein n=1 Tax=Willisornis vidua TaxID=1566151 RepID=A0ABQ9DJ23_9PASS|nr:hypothetical protein WISP_52593 [Willisornis vidua]
MIFKVLFQPKPFYDSVENCDKEMKCNGGITKDQIFRSLRESNLFNNQISKRVQLTQEKEFLVGIFRSSHIQSLYKQSEELSPSCAEHDSVVGLKADCLRIIPAVVYLNQEPDPREGLCCTTWLEFCWDPSIGRDLTARSGLAERLESRIKCALSKFADKAKLCSAVDMSKETDAIQRDLNKVQNWTHLNLMRFNKTKCRVSPYQSRLRDEQMESSPAKKDLGVLGKEAGHALAMCTGSPDTTRVLGCIQSSVGSRGGRGFCPSALLW